MTALVLPKIKVPTPGQVAKAIESTPGAVYSDLSAAGRAVVASRSSKGVVAVLGTASQARKTAAPLLGLTGPEGDIAAGAGMLYAASDASKTGTALADLAGKASAAADALKGAGKATVKVGSDIWKLGGKYAVGFGVAGAGIAAGGTLASEGINNVRSSLGLGSSPLPSPPPPWLTSIIGGGATNGAAGQSPSTNQSSTPWYQSTGGEVTIVAALLVLGLVVYEFKK